VTRRYPFALASLLLALACKSSTDSSTNSSGNVTLTVSNVLSWCSLSITSPGNTTLPNGATASSNVLTLPANTTVSLHVEPNAGFIWPTTTTQGGWSGDLDAGTDRLSKSISVKLSTNKSIKVCCPFPNGTGCS
jgi:hypothetical protein